MAGQLQSDRAVAAQGVDKVASLRDLIKSNSFTSKLPPDPEFSTAKSSHVASRQKLGPRQVKGALYTFVRPESVEQPELLATSAQALSDLGISEEATSSEEFRDVLSGNKIISWDEDSPEDGVYPWAQCYGGYQFGHWAGQLGDGRAISLFETTNPSTGIRYEVQLKGAGRTPYSRFADGKAVLRSSIREFVVSEYLNAIGIPSTRALSLVLTPQSKVVRERLEPGAIVARFAPSWIRFGTFDLLRARGDRRLTRQLAEYVALEVYGGWEKLPAACAPKDESEVTMSTNEHTKTGLASTEVQGEGNTAQNRFARLYRAIARANAKTVAAWQAYGFMNGVLNTDNTSIAGLSIDFGPFAFMDAFDPTYTPNHDDGMLRYSYRAQPSVIWWNLVRLGEALGELIGAGPWCDDKEFVDEGVSEARAKELIERAETIIESTGQEYKDVFMAEYRRLMTARLGLKTFKQTDFEELYSELLDAMEEFKLDFNHTFRRLSNVPLPAMAEKSSRAQVALSVLPTTMKAEDVAGASSRLEPWLAKWRARLEEDWSATNGDDERMQAMKLTNPKFVPRGWILEELIDRVENKHDRDILPRIMKMVLQPFDENWQWDSVEEERICGDVPKYKDSLQCSCSS